MEKHKPSAPKENPKDKLKNEATTLLNGLSSAKDPGEVMGFLLKRGLVDKGTYDKATTYLGRKTKAGYAVSIDGDKIETDFETNAKAYVDSLIGWCVEIVNGDPTASRDVVNTKQFVLKDATDNALKIQSYFGADGVRALRTYILDGWEAEYPGFKNRLTPDGLMIDPLLYSKLIDELNTGLREIFNPNMITDLSDLPDLVNGAPDFDSLLKKGVVSELDSDVLDIYVKYLEKIKKNQKEALERAKEVKQRLDVLREDIERIQEEFKGLDDANKKELLVEAKKLVTEYLTLQGFKIEKGVGITAPNGVFLDFNDIGEEVMDVYGEIYKSIEKKGFDETMQKLVEYEERVFKIKNEPMDVEDSDEE